MRETQEKDLTNRDLLRKLGETCSYEKPCSECDVKEKCQKELKERQP